jgi:1,4-dihydroxy-2-naphthoate octaprenyltransferase
MVLGTHYAITGAWSGSAAVASLIPFFLVSNLLLLNQFPDVEADRSVGRDNLPIALGLNSALQVYGLFALLAFLGLGLGVIAGLLPSGALLGLVTLPAALVVYLAVRRILGQGGSLVPALLAPMGINVALTLATPVLMALGIWLWP